MRVKYRKPNSGAVLEDVSGNAAGDFAFQAVTNNSTIPRVSITAVYPDASPYIATQRFTFTRSNTGTTAPHFDAVPVADPELLHATTLRILLLKLSRYPPTRRRSHTLFSAGPRQ